MPCSLSCFRKPAITSFFFAIICRTLANCFDFSIRASISSRASSSSRESAFAASSARASEAFAAAPPFALRLDISASSSATLPCSAASVLSPLRAPPAEAASAARSACNPSSLAESDDLSCRMLEHCTCSALNFSTSEAWSSLDASSAIKVDASCTTPMDPRTFGAAPVALLFSWSPAPFESDASHASTSRSSVRSLARVMSNDTFAPAFSACSRSCLSTSTEEFAVLRSSFCSADLTSASRPSSSASTSSLP
mmetsp:Transcript_43128/g.142767  ORF Transcript_43128/g.142767 Transcript_43128/m.142767 type:complete len:253 (+) Transcript_43128:404-1162(+)